jgi:hypothetical protein
MYFKLTPKKLETLLNYLKDKPWIEVAQIIIELTNLEKVDEKNNPNPDNKSVDTK